MANSEPVVIASDQSAVPVSASSLPLPTGAATAAKQPAIGTAGSPSTDVISIQGVSSGTAVPISAASLPLPSGAATSAKQDTGNTSLSSIDGKLATAKTTDFDTGAGTDTVQVVGIALPKSGGAVAGGTSSDPIRTDPTGTTTQPVSGTVTANAGSGTFNIQSNASVNLNQVAGASVATGHGTASGTVRVELPTDGTGVVGLNTGTNSIGKISDITTSVVPGTGATNLGKAEDAASSSGDTGVPVWGIRRDAPATNVNAAGDYAEIPVSGQGALWASLTPSTGGGWSVNSQTGLTNTKVAVKASAGIFGGYYIYNPNSSAIYIQIFDITSASVTLGTTAPTYVITIPATSAANLEIANGINHGTAIILAATTTATGSTAPSTALTGFFLYK